MTRLDFIETIKVLLPDAVFTHDDSAKLGEFRIYYDKNRAEVIGKIPYDVAMHIFENYPCEELEIFASPVGNFTCPKPWLTDDTYKSELYKNLKYESYKEKGDRIKKAKAQLVKRPDNNKYLPKYKIETKEGLIVVLRELKKYFGITIDAEEISIEDETMLINSHIIEKINPRISVFECMMQSINVMEFFRGWNRTINSPTFRELRRAIEEFDRSINPFSEKDLSIGEIMADLKNLKFSFNPFNYEDEYRDAYQYYKVYISEKINELSFGLTPTSFCYTFKSELSENNYLYVRHYYRGFGDEEDNGEILEIAHFGTNCPFEKSIRYNITKGTIGDEKKSKKAATELEIGSLYSDLVNATKIAQGVTINNLSKNKTMQL